MKTEKVLEVVLREMTAYGRGWRASWLGFDGRGLQNQLDGIADWAEQAIRSETDVEYTNGTLFLGERTK